MFWVVQNNIFKEQKHSVLMKALKEKNIAHVEVKVVPFSNRLLDSAFDSSAYKGNVEDLPEAVIPKDMPIMVLGGTTLSNIAKSRRWSPGSFLNENFHYENWLKNYGENLLNTKSVIGSLEKIDPPWETFFIRPCEDTKDFAGTVYEKEAFKLWQKELLKNKEHYPFLDSDVVASPVKEITDEYRFFVVDGAIVGKTQYKKNDMLYKNEFVESDVVMFTEKMINVWQPSRAFVIDVAKTSEGLKVIEINNFNSAGFYSANIENIISAIENMKF